MSQQVQELIDKIKTEGVQAADQKAKEIEGNAQAVAQKISGDAQTQARKIIADANQEVKKIQESTQIALKQAARDTLLALRKEIETVLRKIISKQVSGSLSPEHLADMIREAINKSVESNTAENDILVVLSPKDLNTLKDGFIAELQREIKKPIKFQSNNDMAGGFTISYDEGKSCFDFSDDSLTEYLSAYLNTQVASLLNG